MAANAITQRYIAEANVDANRLMRLCADYARASSEAEDLVYQDVPSSTYSAAITKFQRARAALVAAVNAK